MTDYKLVPQEIIERFPEINTKNYGHGDVCDLNAWGAEIVLAASPDGQGEPVPAGWMLFPSNAWAFLAGEGELDGFSYGERPAGRTAFWWRKVVRELLDAAPQPEEQQPAPDVAGLVEALEVVKTVLESDDPAIADTIWVPDHVSQSETLYDYICSALATYLRQGGDL